MVQQNDGGTISIASSYEKYNWDEDITLSGTFEKVLLIDAVKIKESTIQFINNGTGTEIVSYKIFASAKKALNLSNANPELDDEWINLLSSIPYDHTSEKTIPVNSRVFETFNNPWRYIIVMALSATGTPPIKIWHRGEY